MHIHLFVMADIGELTVLARRPDAVCTTTGFTGVEVYLIPELNAYLKIGRVDGLTDLKREAEVLKWLDGRSEVPRLVEYASDNEREALLISAIDGEPLSETLSRTDRIASAENLTERAAEALARLHSIPIHDCPFDARLEWRFARAKRNAEQHLLSESDEGFASEHAGKMPLDVYAELLERPPTDDDLVFTHGDPCMPNIIFRDYRFSGFIDLDGAGVADRYVDIAIFLGSVRHNTDLVFDIEAAFRRGYNIDELDARRLEFYTLMDHLY